MDKLHAAKITLSTIAVGGDADQQLLQQLARQGDGRYYFADHARDIPRFMTREAELATRGPLVEGTISPRQVAPDAALSALAAGGFPTLGGYLVTTPKDLAEVLLVSDAADPLLARWPYGLGRAVAWTSDLRGRWSQSWLQWPGMPQLFSSLVSWTIPANQGPLRIDLRAGPASAHVTVDEAQPSGGGGQVQARVAQPGGEALQVPLSPTAPGRFEGEFPLGGPGTYIVRVADQSRDGTVLAAEAGLPLAYSAEFRQVRPDTRRLEQIARATGGHVLSNPADAFADDLAAVASPLPLERALLIVAAILLALNVALHRLRISLADVLEWLRHPQRVAIVLPWREEWAPRTPAWVPGMRKRAPPARVSAPIRSGAYAASVTPGLARQSEAETAEEEALSATLRWLAERRGTRGDAH